MNKTFKIEKNKFGELSSSPMFEAGKVIFVSFENPRLAKEGEKWEAELIREIPLNKVDKKGQPMFKGVFVLKNRKLISESVKFDKENKSFFVEQDFGSGKIKISLETSVTNDVYMRGNDVTAGINYKVFSIVGCKKYFSVYKDKEYSETDDYFYVDVEMDCFHKKIKPNLKGHNVREFGLENIAKFNALKREFRNKYQLKPLPLNKLKKVYCKKEEVVKYNYNYGYAGRINLDGINYGLILTPYFNNHSFKIYVGKKNKCRYTEIEVVRMAESISRSLSSVDVQTKEGLKFTVHFYDYDYLTGAPRGSKYHSINVSGYKINTDDFNEIETGKTYEGFNKFFNKYYETVFPPNNKVKDKKRKIFIFKANKILKQRQIIKTNIEDYYEILSILEDNDITVK